jgi:hypothetical protein
MVMSPLRLSPMTDCTTYYRPDLSSERAPQDEEKSNCLAKERKKKNLVMVPKGVPDTRTDRPTDHRSQHQLTPLPDLSSKRRCTKTILQFSDSDIPTGSNIWSQVPEWARHLDIVSDWPPVVTWLRLRPRYYQFDSCNSCYWFRMKYSEYCSLSIYIRKLIIFMSSTFK